MKHSWNIGQAIGIALIGGIISGELIHLLVNNQLLVTTIAEYCDYVSLIFLRLIKMIIAPLIFTTLISGIAQMGSKQELGKIFIKAMIVFIIGGLSVLSLGLVLGELLKPGVLLHTKLLATNNSLAQAAPICEHCQITLRQFIEQMIPSSALQGFVENHMLQVIIVTLLFGFGGLALGPKFRPIFATFEVLSQLMFTIINYIMWLAPLAVFTSLAKIIMLSGASVLQAYLIYIVEFYLGLAIIWLAWIIIAYFTVGRRLFPLLKSNLPLYATAFAAASSESILPAMLANFPKHGFSSRISSLVVPLGYAFNLEAAMFNCTFATLFILQIYGYSISLSQEIIMLLMLMITTKGIAGVPRASLVVVAATLTAFGYPESGILILLPIDGINDMGRSATSAFTQTMAALVVEKWELRRIHN